MEREKSYERVKFPPEVIARAAAVFVDSLPTEAQKSLTFGWEVSRENESWAPESAEEFAASYREDSVGKAKVTVFGPGRHFYTYINPWSTRVHLNAPSNPDALRVLQVFDEVADEYRRSAAEVEKSITDKVTIFLGHGRSAQWSELKNFLTDKHGFTVTAYETGPRAGLTMVHILEELSEDASFAILVHTGEDVDAAGNLHARENVVHETGLFQGKLGFERAIVLLEEDCTEFSNLLGLQQIRYSKGNIKETFGEVVATIFREFGEASRVH